MSPVKKISFSKNLIGDFVSFKQNVQLSIFSSQKALSQDLIVYCFYRSHTLPCAGLELSFIHYTNRRANGADNLLNFEPLTGTGIHPRHTIVWNSGGWFQGRFSFTWQLG